MTITEKVAYLKGLMEGLDLDKTTKEGKVLDAMADILDDLALTVADNCDQIDAIDEDLESLEEYVYDDFDFDDDYDPYDDEEEGEYEFECPNCGAKLEGFYEEEDED